jgi:Galactose oxidase, central domain
VKYLLTATICFMSLAMGVAGESSVTVLPAKVKAAGANTWVEVAATGAGGRRSGAVVWSPGLGRFLCLGGRMSMPPKRPNSAYSEQTFNVAKLRWENRFPPGKEGVWGAVTGSYKPPGFGYHKAFRDDKGGVRPRLDYGYKNWMFLYHNYAYDSHRKRVIVYWHILGKTSEYDPATRTWKLIETKEKLPLELRDGLLWGSMCYDPVNKEVLGSQGRWIYKPETGKWSRLAIADPLLDPLRTSCQKLHAQAKRLAAACRLRYYQGETAEEARADLSAVAGALTKDVRAFQANLLGKKNGAKGQPRRQIEWAAADLNAPLKALGKLAASLPKPMSAVAIAAADAAREGLEKAAETLMTVPPKRANSQTVYDAKNRKIVMFGGDRLDSLVADTWVYDCATRKWQSRRPSVSPKPRAGHALLYLPGSGKILLVDGYGYADGAEMWTYDVGKDQWQLLEEGGGERPAFNRLTFGLAAVAPGDVVLAVDQGNKRRPEKTFMARIDAGSIDAAGTRARGVPAGSVTVRMAYRSGGGRAQPQWYEKNSPPVESAKEEAFLKELPVNTWVHRKVPNFARSISRGWSRATYDPDRQLLLHWGGGHCAHCGTDVLVYSLRTNRYFSGARPEYALNWNGGIGCPPHSHSYRGRPSGQHNRGYAYDFAGKRMYAQSYFTRNYFAYDPAVLDWTAMVVTPFADKYKHHYQFAGIMSVGTPAGLVTWVGTDDMWLLDGKTRQWRKLPLKGKLPGVGVDKVGIAYDSKRDRVLCFNPGGNVAYDMKTGSASPLARHPSLGKRMKMRENVYVAHLDMVLNYNARKVADGKKQWLALDCARKRWVWITLAGPGPFSHSTGLNYDAQRKLVWMMDSWSKVYVLRLDLKKSKPEPAKEQ